MALTCGKVLASSSTSSAKRKFVSLETPVAPSFNPYLDLCHFTLTCRMMSSRRQLKMSELSGSPCFVPRSMLKFRLRVSVLIFAV
eukprot:5826896-Pyramimonas_sp.AAC.1